MRLLVLVIAVAGCGGMRPVLDDAGREIATWTGAPVRSLGEGCYVARHDVIYACTIDPSPAGQPMCAIEAPPDVGETVTRTVELLDGSWDAEPGFVHAGRSPDLYHTGSFVAQLDARRCHQRWYDTFELAPTALVVSSRVPLGLHVAPRITFDRATAIEVCRSKITSDRISARVCRTSNGRVIAERTDLDFDSRKVSLRASLMRALAAATADAPGCSTVEVSVSGLSCTGRD